MYASIIGLSRRDAHQQGLQRFVTTELFEQETDVVDEVQVIGEMRPDVVKVRGCTLNLPRRRSVALASALNNCASCWPIVTNAHAVLDSACVLN